MSRTTVVAIKSLVTTLLIVDLCVFAVQYRLLQQPYMSAALMGSFLLFATNQARKSQFVAAFFLGAGYACIYALFRHESLITIYLPAFLGVGSLAVQGLAFIWGSSESRAGNGRALLSGIIFPLFLFCTGICLAVLDQANSRTYDHFLYVFDLSLGFSPSFTAGQLLAVSPLLKTASYYAYEFLPLAMSVAFMIEQRRGFSRSPNVLTLFLTISIAGYIVYQLYPAVGPIYLWPDRFPWNPLPAAAVSLEKIQVGLAARNAMPSLHFAAALAIWFVSRSWRIWLRIAAGCLLVLTVLATLGFGEHYVIDLVVAVPLVVGATAWSTKTVALQSPERLTPLLGGGLLTSLWIALLRYGVPLFEQRPWLSWSLIIISVALPLFWEARLMRFADRESPSADGLLMLPETGLPKSYGLAGAID